MHSTGRDYANKDWLRDQPFQLIDPQEAGAILFFALALAVVLERAGWL